MVHVICTRLLAYETNSPWEIFSFSHVWDIGSSVTDAYNSQPVHPEVGFYNEDLGKPRGGETFLLGGPSGSIDVRDDAVVAAV